MSTTNFSSGAVRSADANHLDYTSIPWVGLMAVARTSAEGAEKYGRFNYMLGMPVHDLLNHVMGHIVNFMIGDRTEPHLAHAAWGLMAAVQSDVLDPELSAPHLLGPGATLTEAIRKNLDDNKARLAERRARGDFADSGYWSMYDLPEILRLLEQRDDARDRSRRAVVDLIVGHATPTPQDDPGESPNHRLMAGTGERPPVGIQSAKVDCGCLPPFTSCYRKECPRTDLFA